MHVQFNVYEPSKLESFYLINDKYSLDQILSSKKLYQYSYENFSAHPALHTSKHRSFVKNKLTSPHSPSAQFCLNFSQLHGRTRRYGPLKITFVIILNVILGACYLSHVKPFLLMILIFVFFITNHHLHYQRKTTHFFLPLLLNKSQLQHFVFTTTFSSLNYLRLNCTY